jgi:uncharacterized protein YgbK (DUF1537 family)
MEVAIIADDLTGACDSAVGFARTGRTAAVAFHPLTGALPEAQVVAVDADSRSLGAGVAADRAGAATRALRTAPLLVKKLDSTLRGQVAAELGSALAASGRQTAIVAPAFPAYGRTTVGAVQLLDGRPVHEGAAGRDPISPARCSDLAEILSSLGTITTLPREDAVSPEAVRRAVRQARVIVADAATDSDLDGLVNAVGDSGAVMWAGSTGISHALGRVLPGAGAAAADASGCRHVVVVVGSLNPVARTQLERLLDGGGAEITWLDGAADAMPDSGELGPVTVVASTAPDGLLDSPRPRAARATAQALARAAAHLVERGADGLVVTGGDTAIAVIRALGASGFTVLGEVETGVPRGVLRGPNALHVVTKAGGFGSPDALASAVAALRSDESAV